MAPTELTQEQKEAKAIAMQRYFRGFLARKRAEALLLPHYSAIVNGVAATDGKDGKAAIKARPLTAGERALVTNRTADGSKDRTGKKYTEEQRKKYLQILQDSDKIHYDDAATTIQAVFRGYQARKALKKSKEKEGEAKTPSTPEERAKAAILIQAQVRGHQAIYVVDSFRIKRFNAMLNDSKKNTQKFERLTEDDINRLDERMRSLGMVAVKGWAEENMMNQGQEMNKGKDKAFGLYEGYRKIKEEIDRDAAAQNAAASKIQKWFRDKRDELRAKETAKPKTDPNPPRPPLLPTLPAAKTAAEIEKEIRDYIANQKNVTIDSRQLKKEMGDPAKMGSPAQDYEPFNEAQKNQWIDGIYGHTNYPKDIKGNPIPPVDKDGNTIPWDEHLGMERARGLLHQTIELSPAGVPIAVYSSLLELQRDIDKVKKKHEIWNFPGKVNPMGFDEVKTSLVRYNDPQATRPCYIMLTETREGITQHFVNDTVLNGEIKDKDGKSVNGKITTAEEENIKTDAYVQKVAILYSNKLDYITDDATRMETAHLIVRQEIRDKMMNGIIDEVHQDQKQHKALRPLDEEDLKRLSDDEDFRASIGQAFLSYKVPPATFKRGAVSISKAYRAADIVWDLAAEHTDFKINIPDTNFYIGVHIATEAREHTCWVNGALRKVYREKGEVWIDDNTCHYSVDGKNYEPLCTHTDYLQRNTGAKRLVDHVAAKTQFGGITGRAQEFIDAFAIKVRSPYGVAVKVGRNVVGSILDPIAHVDKDGKQVKIVKALPTVGEINKAHVAGNRWQGADDKFVQCSVHLRQDKKTSIVTNFSKPILALQGEVPYFGRDMSTQERENNKIADIVEEKLEQKLSGIFIKIKHIPNKKDVKGERHIEGEYYRDVVPYKYDGAAYVEITPSVLYNELRAVKLAMDKEATSNNTKVTISEEDIDKYAERFFERVTKKVRVRNLLSENQFEENEEKLRFNARNGHLKRYYDADGVSVEGVEDIIKKYTDLDAAIREKFAADKNTSEEIAEFRSKMVFDINAKDPETSRTALHLAAMSGQQAVVAALMAAGADPTIKDQDGKTAAELARKEGKFNPKDTNSWVVKLESGAEKFKLAQSRKEVEDLKRDSAILQGRAAELRERLTKLEEEIVVFTGETQVAFAKTPEDAATKAASQDALAKWLKDLDDARAESIKAENLAIAALEKSKGKAPKGPKIKAAKVVPDDNTYKVENSLVDLGGGKIMKIPYYYAIEDGVVPVYVNGKQENIMMKAGEVMFAKNTVLLINADGSEFAQPVKKLGMRASNPDGWSNAEWKDKACDFHEAFVKETKKNPQLFHDATKDVKDGKGNVLATVKFTEPDGFTRTPSSATVKHPTATVISEIEQRKEFVADLKKERAKAKEDIDKYAERFFERVTKKVRVRNLLSENQFEENEENEEKLRYNARNGHLKSYNDAAEVSVEGVEDIIKKYTDLDAAIKTKFEAGNNTSEEIAEFRSKMVFDINAKDPETSRTALHLAAMSGQQAVVAALMAAGADPTIKDQNGKTAAQLARKEGHFNPKDTNSWVVKLESDAEKFKLVQSPKEVEDLKRDSAILQRRAAELREKLVKLVEDVKGFTTDAKVEFNKTPEDAAAKGKSQDALAKGLKDLDDARAASIKAENLAIAALEKSEGKAPKGPKIKAAKVVLDDNTYEVENSLVDLGGDKKMKIPCYYAKEDGVVPVYVNGKQENIMMKAGEVMFAKNTVLLINADGREFAQPVKKFGLRASNPDGWSDAEWKDQACEVHEAFVRETKKDPSFFHGADQDVNDSKGVKLATVKFTEPAGFTRTPSSATVKNPTAVELSEIKERKQFVADLKKERAKAKEVAQKVGGGAAHT